MAYQRKICRGKMFTGFLFSYLMVLLIPIIVGTVAYNEAVKIVERDTQEASLSTLDQCMVALDKRFAEVEGIATQLSMNTKVWEFARESSPYVDRTVPYKINELQQEIAPMTFSNNFINMLCIYFKKSQVTISTTQSYITLEQFYDGLFKYGDMDRDEWYARILENKYFKEYFPVTPIYLGAVGESKRKEAEPMLMYMQSFPPRTLDKGHIMVFIPRSKIEDLLQDIIVEQKGYAYIIGSEGNVLTTISGVNQNVNFSDIYLKESNGFTIQNVEGEKMIVTYKTSPYNGWKYVAVLPYHIVMERVQYIKQLVVAIIGISLLLGLLGAYFMAYRSCKPIRSIIDIIREMLEEDQIGNARQNEYVNEYVYLRKSILSLMSNNKHMQENLQKQVPLIKATFIQRLLFGDFSNEKEIQSFLTQLGFKKYNGRIAVAISRIDNATSASQNNVLEMSAIKLILKDTIEKYLGEDIYYHDMDFDKRVVIFGVDVLDDSNEKNYVQEILEHVCDDIHQTHNISIYFTIGSLTEDYMGISRSFEEAREALDYKTLHSDKSILWHWEVPKNRETYYYPLNMETRIVNFAKLGDWKEINKIFRRVYRENFVKRNLSPMMMVQFVYELKGTILKILDILAVEHEGRIKEIEERVRIFEDCRSIDEMFSFVLEVYQEICSVAEEGKKTRSDSVVDKVIDYIHANYFDSQLSLTGLADRFGFAYAYLCKLFKDNIGKNFSTYLEEIRIEKACELLSKGVSVNQVSKEVGYNSVYVFRKAFKRVKGVAPSLYKGVYTDTKKASTYLTE